MMAVSTALLLALAVLWPSPSCSAGLSSGGTGFTIRTRVVSVPAGYTSCTIQALPPQDLVCEKPESATDPVFIEGTEVNLDEGELQKCRIEARTNVKRSPLVACLAVPPIIILDPIVQGQEVELPYGAVECIATSLGNEKLNVECKSPKPGSKEVYFSKGVKIILPDEPFETCTIYPTQSGAKYNCTKLVVQPLMKATLIKRSLQVPEGAAKCLINNLAGSEPSSITCLPPEEGSDEATFSDRSTVTLPDGDYASCQVVAAEGSDPDISCDPLPYLVVGDVLISGQEILLPSGAALCMATSFKGQPIVTCIPAPPKSNIPKFPEDLRAYLPEGDFGRCIVTPDQGVDCDQNGSGSVR